MNYSDFLWPLIGGQIVGISAAAWLIRSLVGHFLNKDTEVYKLNLSKKIEEFRIELGSRAFEHQVRFSRLHELRAEVIAELYYKLIVLNGATSNFVNYFLGNSCEENERNLISLRETVDDFQLYFKKHQIYFDDITCNKIEELNKMCSEVSTILAAYTEGNWPASDSQILVSWKKSTQRLNDDIPSVMRAIKQSFSNLLGVWFGAYVILLFV